MIKSTYKKRKRSETLLKKGATVGVITAAGVIEAKSGFKGTKIAAKGIQKGVEVGSKGLKSVKDFAGGISKTFKDTMNPPAPKKIPKSHRLNAGNLQHDKLTPKPKLLGPGSGVDKPATIHPPAPKKPVRRGQGGQPKPPKMTVPKLTGGVVGEQKIGGRRIAPQTLNTTGMPKGPGTTAGSFKPKLTVSTEMQKVKKSATKRAKKVIKNAPDFSKPFGSSLEFKKRRDEAAKKVRGIRKRASAKIDKIAGDVSKATGRAKSQVKQINKVLSTPAGRAALNKKYGKAVARVAAKGAGRLVPGVGAVMLAKDIYDVGKYVKKKRKKK
jgi:hypothetical protein